VSETIKDDILVWLAGDGVGESSKCMAYWLGLGKRLGRGSHPYDPADLDRCLRLLEYIPQLKPLIPTMAEISPQWAALASRWEELAKCHVDEVGIGWTKARSAPKTYALMGDIVSEIAQNRN
jgi:hypothetical protein